MRARLLVAAFICSLAVHHGIAAADDEQPIIVFEAHSGERTADVAHIMERLRDELEPLGFAARPATFERVVGNQAPRPGISDHRLTFEALNRLVEEGSEAYMTAKWERAVELLTRATIAMSHNPALLVQQQPGGSSIVFRAYVPLSISLARLGRSTESSAFLSELIRMYPSQPVSAAQFGPRAEELYSKVHRRMQAHDRGALNVVVSNRNAIVFVDTQFRGVGTVALRDLMPGTYRVLVQVPGTAGRRYEIDVRSGETSTLDVPWDIHAALNVDGQYVGFQLDAEGDHERSLSYGAHLMREWTAGRRFGVVWVTRPRGELVLFGMVCGADGTLVRGAATSIGADGEAGLKALARFLADGTRGDQLEVMSRGDAAHAAAAPRASHWRRGTWLIAGGVAAIATSAVLYTFDEDPVTEANVNVPPRYRDTMPWVIGVGAVGVASIGVGLWWRIRTGRTDAAPTVSVGSAGTLLGWAGRF